jgi:hypothetical protein
MGRADRLAGVVPLIFHTVVLAEVVARAIRHLPVEVVEMADYMEAEAEVGALGILLVATAAMAGLVSR